MKVLLQRVKSAAVRVEDQTVGSIGRGCLLLVGITHDDDEAKAKFLADKCCQLRIFPNAVGKINDCSVADIGGELLVVSQFTLYGDCRKGRRPGFDQAAPPEKAEALYRQFVEFCRAHQLNVQTGIFQAMMEVELVNDGPVTFLLEK